MSATSSCLFLFQLTHSFTCWYPNHGVCVYAIRREVARMSKDGRKFMRPEMNETPAALTVARRTKCRLDDGIHSIGCPEYLITLWAGRSISTTRSTSKSIAINTNKKISSCPVLKTYGDFWSVCIRKCIWETERRRRRDSQSDVRSVKRIWTLRWLCDHWPINSYDNYYLSAVNVQIDPVISNDNDEQRLNSLTTKCYEISSIWMEGIDANMIFDADRVKWWLFFYGMHNTIVYFLYRKTMGENSHKMRLSS